MSLCNLSHLCKHMCRYLLWIIFSRASIFALGNLNLDPVDFIMKNFVINSGLLSLTLRMTPWQTNQSFNIVDNSIATSFSKTRHCIITNIYLSVWIEVYNGGRSKISLLIGNDFDRVRQTRVHAHTRICRAQVNPHHIIASSFFNHLVRVEKFK